MKRFFYRVRTSQGEVVQNSLMASSIIDVAMKLENKGYIVLEIREETVENNTHKTYEKSKITVLTLSEKKEFFSSFYFLYKSGLSVSEIFNSISNSSRNISIISLCRNVTAGIERGKSLKESLKSSSSALGLAYTMLIAAGEESGKLEENLSNILKNISKQEEIKSNLKSSLTYPAAIFCLAVAAALIFKFFVFEIFAQRAQGNINVNVSGLAFSAGVKIVIIFASVFAVLFLLYRNKDLMNKIKNFVINIRIFGNLMKNYYFANFFSVLAMAYESGIPAAESIMLANSVINIPEINKKIKKAESMVRQGCEAATALGVTGLFSGNIISRISSGEKAGELDKMFKITASDFESSLDTSIKIMLKLVEPIMIIIVGIIVANIAIKGYSAYYNAIFSMF